ncbi:hypothetical protein BVX99_02515 [bacterium F16]|nr:hypothetical protein BVX99_02515 [bacterium F16]
MPWACACSFLNAPALVLVGEFLAHGPAEIAFLPARPGPLVLSQFHTTASSGAVTRLVDMGIDPYLVASSLSAAVAQRLIRRICKSCKQQISNDDIPEKVVKEIAKSCSIEPEAVQIFHGTGCPACGGTGYKGRVAIYEFFLMDEQLEDMITRGTTTVAVRDHAKSSGMRTLRMNGWEKVQAGLSTIDEVLRITTSYDLHYDL